MNVQAGERLPYCRAVTYTLSSGLTLGSATIGDDVYPYLTLYEPAGHAAGAYDLMLSLQTPRVADLVLKAVLRLTAQP